MTNKPENPPAFPTESHSLYSHRQGMSLRDYFAAAALTGIISNRDVYNAVTQVTHGIVGGHEAFSAMAYDLADAMLKARGE